MLAQIHLYSPPLFFFTHCRHTRLSYIMTNLKEVVHGAGEDFLQPPRNQPRIDDTIHRNAENAYQKLLQIAYCLAESGQPLSNIKTLVKCQKANGMRLIKGWCGRGCGTPKVDASCSFKTKIT